MSLIGLTLPLPAQDASPPVASRFTLVEKAFQAFGGGKPDEEAVLRSRLLEPCPDQRIHLDWPVSRGDAARVLWRVLQRQKGFIPTPGYFLDIGPASPLAEPLAMVGGAFLPIERDRFKPDRLIREPELEAILLALQKRLPGGIASLSFALPFALPFAPSTIAGAGTATGAGAIETSSASAAIPIGEQRYAATFSADLRRLERLSHLVPLDQLSSADGFDLRECEDGMADTGNALDSLEINILDLAAMSGLEPAEDRQIRETLCQLQAVLSGVREKLRLSERTLAVALLPDGDSLRRAAVLKQRLHQHLDRITRLVGHIRERLERLPEEKTP